MRYSLMLALMILPDVAFAATPEPDAPACYTQRTRPDNVVLPKARAADTMELPALHLPDASVRNEPVTIVLDLHVSAAGKVDHAILQEGSSVAAWNAGVLKNADGWGFVPGTIDGEPTAMCIRFRITATLQGN